MATQSLLWTVLPNGHKGKDALRASVLLSPRLDPQNSPESLKSFPDFIDWPKTLSRAVFIVEYGADMVAIPGDRLKGKSRIDNSLAVADSSVWQALFPINTFVRGFQFKDMKNKAVLSYEAHEVADLISGLYSRLATISSDQLPELSTIQQEPKWAELIQAMERCDRRYVDDDGMYNSGSLFKDITSGFMGSDLANDALAQTLARMRLFHTPPATPEIQKYNVDPSDPRSKAQWRTYKRSSLPNATDFKKEIDFHQIVAAMNQYPTLLRKLGLVVDLLIDPGEFSAASLNDLHINVELPSLPTGARVQRVRDASPYVQTLLDNDRFESVSRPNPQLGDFTIKQRLLDFDKNKFELIQTDIDGAGLKMMNFARSLNRYQSPDSRLDPVSKFENQAGVPTLRNAGLMLVQRNRGSMLYNTFQKASINNQAIEKFKNLPANSNLKPPSLYAEDLLRGYRIDIWDGHTRIWRSLCERRAAYSITDLEEPVVVNNEEGTVRLAATQSADETSNQNFVYLHEALMSWTGWSLCVPPPGKTIDKNDTVANADAEIPPGLRLDARFAPVKNSLPRLRYGRPYWLRARAVDLAGNSLQPREADYADEKPQDNALPYLRYDPVAAPVVALVESGGVLHEPAEGESMEHIAIRSFNNKPADNLVATTQVANRFIVPVQSSVRDCEQHGMLDAGSKVDANTFTMLANRDEQLDEVRLTLSGPLTATASEAIYAVFDENGSLPYLPDPLAVEIAARFFGHPTIDSHDILSIPLYGDGDHWPNAHPFKVHVYEAADSTEKPSFDIKSRTLNVPLPKGERAVLRLSVKLSTEALGLMGVWNWLSNFARQDLEVKATNGQHWMLTPWRNVALVHAVQRPLISPKMSVRDMDKRLRKTFVHPKFIAIVSLKSTDHLDLRAQWNEPDDEAGQGAGSNIVRNDKAFSVKITDPDSYAARYFDPAHAGIPDHHTIGNDKILVGAYNDWQPTKSHEFNDTRYRRIEYWLEATTRFREYLPANLISQENNGVLEPVDEKIKVIGKKVVTWVENSSPPPAPEVLYVVPTFGWVRAETPSGKSSWRRGGGLRVYLDRPWNTTGYGEMLAVVLPSAKFSGDPNQAPAAQPLKGFVTQWGNDPIWKSAYVKGSSPKRNHFPLARTEPDTSGSWLPAYAPAEEADQGPGSFKVSNLSHPSLRVDNASTRVEIAPHDVFYDAARELWYCDIEVNFGTAYYPFIRLALARYQPVSVDDAHLSNIVLADFMSLSPDRWLNITHTSQTNVCRVSVSGSTYTDSSGHQESKKVPVFHWHTPDGEAITVSVADVSASSIVKVWVERFDPERGEDFGWQLEKNAVITPDIKPKKKTPVRKKSISDSGNLMRVQQAMYANSLFKARDFVHLLKEDLVEKLIGPPILWQGTVTLPIDEEIKGIRYRLVIAEYEEYMTDDLAPYNDLPTSKDRRLVYLEHVEL